MSVSIVDGMYSYSSDVGVAELCDTVGRISLRWSSIKTACRVHPVLWLIPGGAA